MLPPMARPDTLTVAANVALARVRLAESESAMVAVRAQAAAAATQRPRDSVTTVASAVAPQQRDSLNERVGALQRALTRAEQAPLPSSYKALADLPDVRGDPRIHALVDSLSEIEREREGFGAVGGVDPVFVALTSRANEIGRAIQSIASERQKAMGAQLVSAGPPPETVATPAVDTAAQIATRDSVRAALEQASDSLSKLRSVAQAIDREEQRARERASAVAPPLALLASAFVLSAVIGFATAFVGELRRPRVSDGSEVERMLGVRVLSTVEPHMPSAERGRRQADRSAPPYFDPGAEGYQLAYLGIATENPTTLAATVIGDDAAITALVACNLAAISADEARNTLVVDIEPSCMVSAALRTRIQPGIVDVLAGQATWPDVTISAPVGRDKSVDLVPYGLAAKSPSAEEISSLLRQDTSRLTRYYDAIFVVATPASASAGIPTALSSADVIYCARPGITPLRQVRDHLDQLRKSGAIVRGIVLWNAERPLLPTPKELASRARSQQTISPKAALVAS